MMLVGSFAARLNSSYWFRVTLARLNFFYQHGVVAVLVALLWLFDR